METVAIWNKGIWWYDDILLPHILPCPGLLLPAPLLQGGCLQANVQLPEGPRHHQTAQDPWGPSITVLIALRLPAAQIGPLLASQGEYSPRFQFSFLCIKYSIHLLIE